MNLERVRRFRINPNEMRETVEAIQTAGKSGDELFVLWSGTCEGDTFAIAKAHIPNQISIKSESGCVVMVEGPELHRINVWLYEARQVIVAQIHSHPTEAYHSSTDNNYPIATLEGSLSIVLPFFGRDGWASDEIAAYRLGRHGWVELTAPLSELIEVVEDGSS